MHAEASGHPKVGSAESRLNERLADSSAPMWKVTSSKGGKGSFEDLAEGSDDEYRNGISDDLDYQIRRTYGVTASVAPKLPMLLVNVRCIACSQEASATNLGICEAFSGVVACYRWITRALRVYVKSNGPDRQAYSPP